MLIGNKIRTVYCFALILACLCEKKMTFSNGAKYLESSQAYLKHPSYHARKILELLNLYSKENLEKILCYCLSQNIYNINKMKEVIKEKNLDILYGELGNKGLCNKELISNELIRDCSYYSEMEVTNGS